MRTIHSDCGMSGYLSGYPLLHPMFDTLKSATDKAFNVHDNTLMSLGV